MDTTWYLSSDTFAADNMTSNNATAVADGFTLSQEPSEMLAGMVNFTTVNSSGGNSSHMPECDTNNPILIIITQVNKCTQSYQHV
jgi:hypothetical protein